MGRTGRFWAGGGGREIGGEVEVARGERVEEGGEGSGAEEGLSSGKREGELDL